MKQGVIALDIDGTITDERHMIADEVAIYLSKLSEQWHIFLITGRTFSFAERSLRKLAFPYTIGFQNGADILHMPEKRLLRRSYIDTKTLCEIEAIIVDEPEDMLVYSGYERGDFCYYRPEKLSKKLLNHVETLARLCSEPWVSYKQLPIEGQDSFPLVKYMSDFETTERVSAHINALEGVQSFSIRDPFIADIQLALITHKEANKGSALQWILDHQKIKLPVIAAGDDNNDQPMLDLADTRIVIETAPTPMQRSADIVAKRYGIIEALEEAIRK